MKKRIALCGTKQSGKTTSANAVFGHTLLSKKIIKTYEIDEEGRLFVPTEKGMGQLDIDNQSVDFKKWCDAFLWRHVKNFNLADPLKEFCRDFLELEESDLWGGGASKESKTHITWESFFNFFDVVPKNTKPNKKMTVREVLQSVGTVMRQINKDIFVNKAIKHIENYQSDLSVITDCRFDNEFNKLKKSKVFTIYLARRTHNDKNIAENGFVETKEEDFDLVIPGNLTIGERNEFLIKNLIEQKILVSV